MLHELNKSMRRGLSKQRNYEATKFRQVSGSKDHMLALYHLDAPMKTNDYTSSTCCTQGI